MTHNRNPEGGRGRDLRNFERNRFFHGKLMTARDMQAEQDYHVGKLNALSRLVVGEGILRGLDVAVEDVDDKVAVTIEPGVAVDSAGRLIVIEHAVTERLPAPSRDKIFLFVAYDEASKDRVPVPGSDRSYEEDCTYNRILESFDVYYMKDPPDRYKSVPDVVFPDSGEVDEAGEDALVELARTYHQEHLDMGGYAVDTGVFLGSFERQSGAWVEAAETDRRPYVYTNDMLYAGLVRHVADQENPHDVSVEGVSDELVERLEEFQSADEFVGRLDELEQRLNTVESQKSSLERYVMTETLEAKISAFGYVKTEFGSGTAEEIVERTRNLLQTTPIVERADYLDFIETILEWESALEHELDDEATSDSLERYADALTELKTTMAELADDESVVPVAMAQKQVCTTAELLTSG